MKSTMSAFIAPITEAALKKPNCRPTGVIRLSYRLSKWKAVARKPGTSNSVIEVADTTECFFILSNSPNMQIR